MFRDGLRYAFSHPGLRLMMGISVAAALLARSVPEILPGYAALFGHEAELFARMSAVVGAGAMLGGILVARGRSPRRLALMALTAAGALACIVILLALAPGRVPALALLFLLGTALVVSAVSNLSVIQMTADPSRRGRVGHRRPVRSCRPAPGPGLLRRAVPDPGVVVRIAPPARARQPPGRALVLGPGIQAEQHAVLLR